MSAWRALCSIARPRIPGPRSNATRCGVSIVVWLAGCALEPNYLDPDGPRYSGDHAVTEPVADETLLIVSYNLAFGVEVETAIAVLGSELLAGADVILMQEMDPIGVDRIAEALQLRYVYYPASVKKGKDWGNAILSRWQLHDDRKVRLPYADPYSDTRRIAVGARIDVGDRAVWMYSTHLATPTMGLGARLEQMETILEDTLEGPAVIGGDLNTAEPGSAGQMRELCGVHGFSWASDQASDTASAWGLYGVTLDYVFARGFESLGSGTFAGDSGSDHQPIWADLAW